MRVALYTSAWIEIATDFAIYRFAICRTLHECVDWNHCFTLLFNGVLVALYTSAWIEIIFCWESSSFRIRRTLHECVDWNSLIRQLSLQWNRSHSTRVRGLKSHVDTQIIGVDMSHSTRVRGLKSSDKWRYTRPSSVALYTSAWIEIH